MDPRKRAPTGNIDLTNIVSGPRAKRTRVTYTEDEQDADQDVEMAETTQTAPSAVMRQGMRLWNAVRNYTDAEGNELAVDFLKLISKKLYPDYYKVIARPMALDMVKSRLELDGYPSLESVMADMELIFENAKQYNVEGSAIYRNAEDLHAALLQEYRSITGVEVKHNEKQEELDKLLTQTTNELCQATDETGLTWAYHFMELPDGNLYPQYYVVIQKPMCFNHILASESIRLLSSANISIEKNLETRNAYTFNEDGSPIVTQAKALQLLYNTLVDKFPPEFAVEKSIPKPNVIKLKVGRPRKSDSHAATPPAKPRQSSSVDTPRHAATPEVAIKVEESIKMDTPPNPPTALPQTPVPATPISVKQPQTPVPQMPPPSVPQTPARPPAPPAPIVNIRAPFPTQTRPYGYPPQLSQSPIPPGPPFQSSFVLGPPTPLPEGMMKNPITHVGLRTLPIGRTIWLDAKDGVTSWSIRLAGGKREHGLSIDRVDIEDDEDIPADEMKEEPEEPRPRKRGRPPTRSLAAQQAMMNGNGYVKRVAAIEYLRGLVVKLNGKQLLPVSDAVDDPTLRQWNVDLAPGASVLDIGAWRVYIDRD
ncbi:SubName: Full=Related to RSC complex protein-Laccaria bicolor {ECO:0000313/EMBL:CCA74147.1} [Serendipita indica DSM 11827]|uniref:Related to RSC complex protein-Laccaria bicolor n=1 Tax=Serendipita indica (strain DSM 11827) TaxID=1109443 RepID=G4TS54_SERID|nr:SubName: Full=Related to RSC complex protein-Laccaria bicolor {ECO:0000313/EMBL:CCA74147.1} [Serendipita indica DSM 11827]CCA74147.1 related to RSC complex protein-Laccaria bicolor [Serendipita indica DSM 11827]